ncbi:MAG: hypothetical protein WDN06_06170 [Asticcacaulis sp.]
MSTLRPTLIKAAILNDVGPVIPPKALARISGLAAMKQMAFKNWHDAAIFIAEQNRQAFPNNTQADMAEIRAARLHEGPRRQPAPGLRCAHHRSFPQHDGDVEHVRPAAVL